MSNVHSYLKLPFRFQLINILDQLLTNLQTYIIINAKTLFLILSNCPQVLKIFSDWPVKYYCWSIWWLSHSAVYTCIFHRGIIW